MHPTLPFPADRITYFTGRAWLLPPLLAWLDRPAHHIPEFHGASGRAPRRAPGAGGRGAGGGRQSPACRRAVYSSSLQYRAHRPALPAGRLALRRFPIAKLAARLTSLRDAAQPFCRSGFQPRFMLSFCPHPVEARITSSGSMVLHFTSLLLPSTRSSSILTRSRAIS